MPREQQQPGEQDRLLPPPRPASPPASAPDRSPPSSGLKQRQSPRGGNKGGAGGRAGGASQWPALVEDEEGCEGGGGGAGGSALPGAGWMRVGGCLIGHGIRVVTDIEGRDHEGRPFSWRADTAALAVRAELPGLGALLPPGPARSVAFWMGALYLLGSLLFVFGAAASLSSYVVEHERALFALVDVPYFVGALIFQVANYFAMVEPLNEDLGFRQYLCAPTPR